MSTISGETLRSDFVDGGHFSEVSLAAMYYTTFDRSVLAMSGSRKNMFR